MSDGRVLNGVIVSQNNCTISLQSQTELLTIERDDVEEIKQTAQSPMPDGQLAALTSERIRNLSAYLQHPNQVPSPIAAP